MNDEHLKTLKATTWEELNPDWIEDGDLTDRFAKSQFDHCPTCDSIENIRVVNSSGDDEMASVLCCNWQCNGDCPSEAIDNWNRRAASVDRAGIVELLTRIRQWDVLDTTSDGDYWKREIDAVLTETEKGK